ncbi:Bardet-Biedl syndrome 5 protein homolog [Eumeta japonica]|uniref:Bardet-Biedl syndrome 5 protein homolog n=1 Tax=Eumeta variegata TaxID=151549 RepID=A0A4C1STF2_EUMVA|nr:Bardet-Biedl syndrome 5 protein homolog [Eumeta japonica]
MAPKQGGVWEDREVLFDLPFSHLRLRPGEKIFDRIEPIEDTKGNSGIRGRMVVTSLRVIWHSLASPRINLSIGLNCIISTTTRVVNSGLRGTTQALYILAAFKTNKYEFIFTNIAPNSVRHYTSVLGVHKAYTSSRLYRDLKLRSAIIHNKHLRILPLEKISIRDSKFGEALVFVTRPNNGGYVLGFRTELEHLRDLAEELIALHKAYTDKPIFGVELNTYNEQKRQSASDEIEEFEEIAEPRGEMGPNLYLASRLAQNKEDGEDKPVYSSYLGLAIEPLKEGFTLKSLFEVQSTH